MKGFQKIKSGLDIEGVLIYCILRTEKRDLGLLIGGNIDFRVAGDLRKVVDRFGDDADIENPQHQVNLIKKQFSEISKRRPTIKKNVFHQALRLTEGETITHAKWVEVGEEYVKRMGLEHHQYVFVLHDDVSKESGLSQQHIHIIANRVGIDGTAFNSSHESMRSTTIITQLEKEFDLVITRSAADARADLKAEQEKIGAESEASQTTANPDSSSAHQASNPKVRLTKGEMEKALKDSALPFKARVSRDIQAAITHLYSQSPSASPPSIIELIDYLAQLENPIVAIPNISGETTNKFNGLSFFAVDSVSGTGVSFKGSQLGFSQLELCKRGIDLQSKGTADDKIRECDELRKAAIYGKSRVAKRLIELGQSTNTGRESHISPDSDIGGGTNQQSERTSKNNGRASAGNGASAGKVSRKSKEANRSAKSSGGSSQRSGVLQAEDEAIGNRAEDVKSGLVYIRTKSQSYQPGTVGGGSGADERARDGQAIADDIRGRNNMHSDFIRNARDQDILNDAAYILNELKGKARIRRDGLRAKKFIRELNEEYSFVAILKLRITHDRRYLHSNKPYAPSIISSFGCAVISIILRFLTFGLFTGFGGGFSYARTERFHEELIALRNEISNARLSESARIKEDIKLKLKGDMTCQNENKEGVNLYGESIEKSDVINSIDEVVVE